MTRSPILLFLLAIALPAAAAPPPEKPGAALDALTLPACDYKPGYWTPPGSLSAPLARGDYAAVEAELEGFHASFERDPACERRTVHAFLHGFYDTPELPAQLDRWVAARPKSWTAYTIRGAMWANKVNAACCRPDRPTPEALAELRSWTEHAVADLERAIALHSRAVVAHASLISTYQVVHATAQLQKAIRRALEIDPVSVHVLTTALTALQPNFGGRLEQVEAIVAAARQHEKENPRVARAYGYPDAWRALKLEWGRTNEFNATMPTADRDRVIAYYSQALRYGEAGSEWNYRRARMYQEQEQHDYAVTDADFALAADPDAERFWVLKVWSLGVLGRFEESIRAAREGQQHVPDSIDLRYSEGSTLYRMGRFDESAEVHRAALRVAKTGPDRVKCLRGLGTALEKGKRYAEAVPVLQEVVRADPYHALTFDALANALWQLGRREEAVPVLERFLALTENKDWATDLRMRAQEKINLVQTDAPPPARATER